MHIVDGIAIIVLRRCYQETEEVPGENIDQHASVFFGVPRCYRQRRDTKIRRSGCQLQCHYYGYACTPGSKTYGIKRSKNRLLLTVAVSRPDERGVPRAVDADVKAYTINMIEQHRKIKMRRISEGEAIYYVGDFGYATPDFLRFTVNVTEPGSNKPHKIEFQRNFDKF